MYPESRTIAAVSHATGTVEGAFEDDHMFFRILVGRGDSLRNHQDARLIWNAYCDVHQRPWHQRPFERIGPVPAGPPQPARTPVPYTTTVSAPRYTVPSERIEWRLGLHEEEETTTTEWPNVESIVRVTSYWEVHTDPRTHRILAVRPGVERSTVRSLESR